MAIVGIVLVMTAVLAPVATPGQEGGEWTIPPGAIQEPNPVTASPGVLAQGAQIFQARCQACHGRDGSGKAAEAEPEKRIGNLTDPLRARFNPDGVMFYKIWNGRERPKMPAFSAAGLSRDEVWTVVHYVKSLRK